MGRAKPWAKLWVNWYHKPDWLALSLAQKGAWWMLYSLAQELESDGRMVAENGTAMSLREIERALHLEDRTDRKIFRRMIEKRLSQQGLEWKGDTLVITEFASEQALTPSKEKDAVKERVRRWRAARQQPTDASRHGPDAPQSVTDSQLPRPDSEAEPPETGGHSVTDVTVLPLSPLSSVSQEDGGAGEGTTASIAQQAMVAELSRCYEETIGLLSGTTRQLIEEFLEEYRGPVAWIEEAFKEGEKYGHRNWAYIRKILMNWQEQGRRGDPNGRQAEADTAERDPLAGARKTGWKVRTVREHDGPEDGDAD